MEEKINVEKLKLILSKFLKVPDKEKVKLPDVLTQRFLDFFTNLTEDYVIISFLTEKEKRKVKRLTNEGYPPYPGLIAPKKFDKKVAFNVETSKNIMLLNLMLILP